ncbi:MAG: helix-turn-helix transcriptional regulator [Muribaculaceae bacterium]
MLAALIVADEGDVGGEKQCTDAENRQTVNRQRSCGLRLAEEDARQRRSSCPHARHHDVTFYASQLNVTPNYLNIISKRNTGTTAKEQINIQIGLVVRMLLDTTDLSVKQIAARLHYDDPSYLCRLFRKQTGMSPLEYRHQSDFQGLYDGSGRVKSEPK